MTLLVSLRRFLWSGVCMGLLFYYDDKKYKMIKELTSFNKINCPA
jgi:hypothetical protein